MGRFVWKIVCRGRIGEVFGGIALYFSCMLSNKVLIMCWLILWNLPQEIIEDIIVLKDIDL